MGMGRQEVQGRDREKRREGKLRSGCKINYFLKRISHTVLLQATIKQKFDFKKPFKCAKI